MNRMILIVLVMYLTIVAITVLATADVLAGLVWGS